ncbi:MAG: hypothetical protein PHE27_04825 [Alphaproteobacteria bacterium]|nr:hypothetical protein [Alphaproteobacteria bacterium]
MSFMDRSFKNPKTRKALEALEQDRKRTEQEALLKKERDRQALLEQERLANETACEMDNARPGIRVGTRGVYLGLRSIFDKWGSGESKVFHVFIAPQDFGAPAREPKTYGETLRSMRQSGPVDGHPMEPYECEADLRDALLSGAYGGGWTLPPRSVISGSDKPGQQEMHTMVSLKDVGDFKGTYTDASWYWSCSNDGAYASDYSWAARFSGDRDEGWHAKENWRYARLCRFEPA